MITVALCLITTFVLLLSALHYLMHQLKGTTKYLTKIPGPKPIFAIGNMLDFIEGSTVFLDKLEAYLEKYGDTVVVLNGSFSKVVVTVDYEFSELLLSSNTHLEKAAQYKFFHGWVGQGIFTSTGAKWMSHRKAIVPSFHLSILQEYISVFNSVGGNLISKLKNEVGKDSLDISELIALYSLDVICETAMGVQINALEQKDSDFIVNTKAICKIIFERMFSIFNPFLYPLTPNFYKERRALKVVHKYVDNVISKRIADLEKNVKSSTERNDDIGVKKRLTFLDLLLEARVDGKPLTRTELRDEVNTFMFAGQDTVASAISFCLFMLATNPETQQKVIEEQVEIFGSNPKSANPTYTQLRAMKYLDLVIKETLRLYPSGPIFGRILAHDLEFKGSLYPKGISVIIFPYVFHRNPRYFSEPDKFIPERFESTNTVKPYSYTPFSAGPRNCIGQKFAMLEMLSAISKVVRNFELLPAKPHHKLQLAAETTLVSKNGVKISLKDRA